MEYQGDVAATQRRIAQTADLVRRRLAVIEALSPQPGERILDVGCGGGALLRGLAEAVGPRGRVLGIDLSADQVAAAAQLCADLPMVETAVQDVSALAAEDGSFDAATAVQVIEYLSEPQAALRELRRTLRPGGRLVVLATNWDTMFFHSAAPDLTARIAQAWAAHAPHPNLPAQLRPLLREAGFRMLRQDAVPVVNNAYDEDAFSYWASRLIADFGARRGLVSDDDAKAWLASLHDAEAAGTYFFSVTPILTLAVAA